MRRKPEKRISSRADPYRSATSGARRSKPPATWRCARS